VVSLREGILKRRDVFVRTMTEKLMTYAIGRGMTFHDMPVIRDILRKSATQDYRFSTIVLGIVNSTPFQMRTAEKRTTAPDLTVMNHKAH